MNRSDHAGRAAEITPTHLQNQVTTPPFRRNQTGIRVPSPAIPRGHQQGKTPRRTQKAASAKANPCRTQRFAKSEAEEGRFATIAAIPSGSRPWAGAATRKGSGPQTGDLKPPSHPITHTIDFLCRKGVPSRLHKGLEPQRLRGVCRTDLS